MELLGTNICKTCMEDISITCVSSQRYDYNKEMIKMILKKYIYERLNLNPVEWLQGLSFDIIKIRSNLNYNIC